MKYVFTRAVIKIKIFHLCHPRVVGVAFVSFVSFVSTDITKPRRWTQRRRQTIVLNKCAGALWESSKNFVVKGKFPTHSQFVVNREKSTPRESKQNIKYSQYNLLYLQNQGKVFTFYSNRLMLFIFFKKFEYIWLFSLISKRCLAN